MTRSKGTWRPTDETPQSIALRDLDSDRSRRSTSRASSGQQQYRSSGPPPAGCGERTWRLVRLFIETGESHQRYRVIYDQALGRMLASQIRTSPPVAKFLAAYGPDWTEDILARMIRIYWRDYVDPGSTNSQIIRGYIEDLWPDLWELARTQYATDEFQRLEAAGQLKTRPYRVPSTSLQYDGEYLAATQEIRVQAALRRELGKQQLEPLESGDADQES